MIESNPDYERITAANRLKNDREEAAVQTTMREIEAIQRGQVQEREQAALDVIEAKRREEMDQKFRSMKRGGLFVCR
ncbi:MAG: hypothetical protein WCT04_24345 [Planctomycetota bacterium]